MFLTNLGKEKGKLEALEYRTKMNKDDKAIISSSSDTAVWHSLSDFLSWFSPLKIQKQLNFDQEKVEPVKINTFPPKKDFGEYLLFFRCLATGAILSIPEL